MLGLMAAADSTRARPLCQGDQASETLSENVEVFATGLIYPRGLKFGADGNLYVAEAGSGGDTESMGTCEGITSMFAPYQIGMTARVSVIAPMGNRVTAADNLPSAQDHYGDVLGVHDIAFIDDTLYALVSGGGCSRGLADFPASVIRVNEDGTTDIVADLSTYFANNPTAAAAEEDYEPDGAAYAMVAHEGKLYVVNANHAAFEEISLDGSVRRVADLSASEGHVTPTAAIFHNGDFYIGTLGKFPIEQGASKVYRVGLDGSIEDYALGLTAVLGVAFDDQDRLYVLETSTVDGELPVAGSGRVVRYVGDDEPEVLVTGLTFPTGMTFASDGLLYVSHHGYGGDPAAGEILRINVNAMSNSVNHGS
jgi:glucose/arabinose dehydrogenase